MYIHKQRYRYRHTHTPGKMVQWLRVLAAFQGIRVQSPAPMLSSLQPPVCPAPGDLTPSYGLTDTIHIHINLIFKIYRYYPKKESN